VHNHNNEKKSAVLIRLEQLLSKVVLRPISTVCVCVCVRVRAVCVLPGSFRGMVAFYFKIENRRDILNTVLLTRITAHEQSLTMGV